MVNDDFSINFSGITHDHTVLDSPISADDENRSTIAILRRHPMYDCLVLVKKFRNCLRGYTLEFPSENISGGDCAENNHTISCNRQDKQATGKAGVVGCHRRQLVSKFLDGDDPIHQSPCIVQTGPLEYAPFVSNREQPTAPFAIQYDDKGLVCELVHVPINGLLDRLNNYNESGVAVDSRVYVFAMGLKTAERILTTNSMKELQESPI